MLVHRANEPLCQETAMRSLPLVVAAVLAACAQTQSSPDRSQDQTQPSPQAGNARPAPAMAADASDWVLLVDDGSSTPTASSDPSRRALVVVNDDGTIAGVIEAPDMAGSTASIEDDAASGDGAIVVVLVPVGDGRWQVPAGTRLTSLQQAHYTSGKLSAHVHNKSRPKSDARAQLTGKSQPRGGDRAASAPGSK
jgi:hypothetical protein